MIYAHEFKSDIFLYSHNIVMACHFQNQYYPAIQDSLCDNIRGFYSINILNRICGHLLYFCQLYDPY